MMRMRKLGRQSMRFVLGFSTALILLVWFADLGLAQDQPKAQGKQGEVAGEKPQPVAAVQADSTQLENQDKSLQKSSEHRLGAAKVAVIKVADIIMGGMEEYIVNSIDRAQKGNYGLLVIQLDTPGGLVQDTQDIVKHMLSARVPIAVFVSPKGAHAGSAGTFITLAGHIAAMAPGTRIGAAHPVQMSILPNMSDKKETEQEKQKKETQQELMNEKITNDVAMFVVSIAKERGRNAQWAEDSVRKSSVITSDEAVKIGVVDLEAESLDELLQTIHGRTVKLDKKTEVQLNTKQAVVEHWDMSLKQRLWIGLASPEVLMLLIMLGIGGLAMEFYHPGLIVPAVVGVICLILTGISIQILPVTLGGLILVLAGIGLMIAEAYVVSYGLLAVGGAVLMVIGGIFLIDPSAQPYYLDPTMQVDWTVLVTLAVTMAGLFIAIGYYVVRTQRGEVLTGLEGMRGEVGEAKTDINAEGGKVFVRGEYWNAKSAQPISKGDKVEVLELEGMLLTVQKLDK